MPIVRRHGFHPRIIANPTLLARGTVATVYALWDGEAVKIGKCKGHPMTRLADLQTGNPRVLRLLAWTTNVSEREAHRWLRSHRARGEWFRLSENLLAEVRQWDWLDTSLVTTLAAQLGDRAVP